MPAAGATAIGTGRIPGQEAIDLSVCIAILKKAIVAIPVVIMIILYLIRRNLTYDNPEEPVSVFNDTSTLFEDINTTNDPFEAVVRDQDVTKRLRRLLKLDPNV